MNLFPLAALSALLLRAVVYGASIGDSIAIFALSALYAYYLLLESQKAKPINKEFIDRLIELEQANQELKTRVASFSIASSFAAKR